MAIEIEFSDVRKTDTIVIPDYPPGINTVVTSLSLAGAGYPNYGQKMAENLVRLLENFASPQSPDNPIEGQIWYDTSDPNNKTLRVMDNTTGVQSWPSVSGIYRQYNDPALGPNSTVKTGDLWVDLSAGQVKLFLSTDWSVVGPVLSRGGSKTGTEIDSAIADINGNLHTVIKTYVDGDVVSVVARDTFVPNPSIPGFRSLSPGINLPTTRSRQYSIAGVARSARSLEIDGVEYSANSFIRNNDSSGNQTITGRVLFKQTVTNASAAGTEGLVINTANSSDYLQVYMSGDTSPDGAISFSKPLGSIVFKTVDNEGNDKLVRVQNGCLIVNTGTHSNPSATALTVNGNSTFSRSIVVNGTSTDALSVSGGILVGGGVNVDGTVGAGGVITAHSGVIVGNRDSSNLSIEPYSNGTQDIGSQTKKFRKVFTSALFADTLNGSAIGPTSLLAPPGMITGFGGLFSPSGWAGCDGSSYSATQYPQLFNAIGYRFGGSGDAFNVPDLRAATASTNGYISYIIKL